MASRRDLVHPVMRRGVLPTSANDPWVLAAVAGLLLGTSVQAALDSVRAYAKETWPDWACGE